MKRLAILLPWFSFFLREKYTAGYVCLALQITLIGWPIASIWAASTLLKREKSSKDSFILRSLRPTFERSEFEMKGIA